MSATASFWVGVVALVIAIASAAYTRQQALLARARSLRERTPHFTVTLSSPAPPPGDRAIYLIHLDGPEELSAVLIHKPHTTGNTSYPVTPTDLGVGWQDAAELGPMRLGDTKRFTLCCGSADATPEFEVRIDCVGANQRHDRWQILEVLAPPRGD